MAWNNWKEEKVWFLFPTPANVVNGTRILVALRLPSWSLARFLALSQLLFPLSLFFSSSLLLFFSSSLLSSSLSFAQPPFSFFSNSLPLLEDKTSLLSFQIPSCVVFSVLIFFSFLISFFSQGRGGGGGGSGNFFRRRNFRMEIF